MAEGYLTQIGEPFKLRPYSKSGAPMQWRSFVECKCACGRFVVVNEHSLAIGDVKSCGCQTAMMRSRTNARHGMSRQSIHNRWMAMIDRCTNVKNRAYPRYGGRGIYVCDEWMASFEAFFRDMGQPPSGMTLDRIDNSKGYSKGNCRWATITEQNSNTRANKIVEFNGRAMTLSEWARTTGIKKATLHYRIKSGWSVADALTRPVATPHEQRQEGEKAYADKAKELGAK